jgi:hypothetical protein
LKSFNPFLEFVLSDVDRIALYPAVHFRIGSIESPHNSTPWRIDVFALVSSDGEDGNA